MTDPITESDCEHPHLPPFEEPYDETRAMLMEVSELRKLWPRRQCPDCNTIVYESFMHRIAGDW